MLDNIKEIAEILVAIVTARYFWYLGTNKKLENQRLKKK